MSTPAEEIWAILREVAESQKDTDRRFKETELKIKEVTANIGRLGNRLGEFIEEAVRPAAVRLFRERGIEIHEVQQNVSVQRGDEGLEVDLMVVNDFDLVAVECKSNLKQQDIDEHLSRLSKIKRLLPKYANSRVMGHGRGRGDGDPRQRGALRLQQGFVCDWAKRRTFGNPK